MIYFCHNYKQFLNKIGLLFIQILNANKLKFKNGLDVYSSLLYYLDTKTVVFIAIT